MPLWAPAPPPVSFSRQIAPIVALHCNGCHGQAGGFSTRSHEGILMGGNLGAVVVPGDPGRSLLLDFIEGRRGEAHRMPLGGRPLTHVQIEAIRRWIAEGARPDLDETPRYTFVRRHVQSRPGKALRVSFVIHTQAYLTITVRDPRSGRVLFTDVGSVKHPKDEADIGEPGQRITWHLRPGLDWPAALEFEVTVAYPCPDSAPSVPRL